MLLIYMCVCACIARGAVEALSLHQMTLGPYPGNYPLAKPYSNSLHYQNTHLCVFSAWIVQYAQWQRRMCMLHFY